MSECNFRLLNPFPRQPVQRGLARRQGEVETKTPAADSRQEPLWVVGDQDEYGPGRRLLQCLQQRARRARMKTVRRLDQNHFGAAELGCDEEKVGEGPDLAHEDAPLARGCSRTPDGTLRHLRPSLIHRWLKDAEVGVRILCEQTTRRASAARFASRSGVGAEYRLCERTRERSFPHPLRSCEEQSACRGTRARCGASPRGHCSSYKSLLLNILR